LEMKHPIALGIFTFGLLMSCAGPSNQPLRLQQITEKGQVANFAEIRRVERIRLAEPVRISFSGIERPVTDFLLIHVRLAGLSRFLQRNIGPDQLMVGDFPARLLWPIVTEVAIVAPVPTEPLNQISVWTAPYAADVSKLPLERIRALKAEALNAGPARSVPIGSDLKREIILQKEHLFSNISELQRYARRITDEQG
jgi:hypothetical protein